MKSNYALVMVAFFGVLLAAFPKGLNGQATNSPPVSFPNETDLLGRMKALQTEDADLVQMNSVLSGNELDSAHGFEGIAGNGESALSAIYLVVDIFDRMQCEPDRELVRNALKRMLPVYSQELSSEADMATKYLALVQLPATAQAGTRIRDDLRAAKSKLDEIAASLN